MCSGQTGFIQLYTLLQRQYNTQITISQMTDDDTLAESQYLKNMSSSHEMDLFQPEIKSNKFCYFVAL